jgi:micrococcal nuclease
MKKALVFLFCISLIAAQSRRIDKGTVVVVYDGDTIKVRFDNGFERRVRLIGIDSAEIEDASSETPLEALLAKRFTFHHLFRKSVELTYEHELEDKYGRLLAYIWTDVGLFNEYILKEGFARVFLKFPYAMKEKFIQAQNKAQEQDRGFWKEEPYPVISVQEVRKHIGKLMRVSFVCARMQKRRNFLFIYPRTDDFAVLIPMEYESFFNDVQGIKGKAIEVFGFLEEYRGQPQIVIFFPSQLDVKH